MEICGICGDDLNKEFTHTITKCNHTFHYKCLLESLKMNKMCPYCRGDVGLLPLVNGLKNVTIGIHVNDISEICGTDGLCIYTDQPCNYILKRGKNKGNQCNKKCKLGYYQCKAHLNKI